MRCSRWIPLLALAVLAPLSACDDSDDPSCEGAACGTGSGGTGGGASDGGTGGTAGSGGTGGAGGSGGSGGTGGTDVKWSAPLDLCDSHYMPNAQIDPFPMLASVGPTPALEDGFSATGKLVSFETNRVVFKFDGRAEDVSIAWPRPFQQIFDVDVGKEFVVTYERGWLAIQAVGVEVVSLLHVETGRNPPAVIGPPLEGRGPTFVPELHCAVTDQACSERAIKMKVHLDGKDSTTNWSGWAGGGIANWSLSNWSRIRTGDCDQQYAIIFAGEGYLFYDP
ncbi:MAG TPA: hypothetical protein VGD74_07935 [Vulgatibacter sp.]